MVSLSSLLESVWPISNFTLVVACVSIVSILWYGYHIPMKWKLRSIPGPKASFLTGNLLDVPFWKFHENFVKWPAQYGKLTKYFMGRDTYVLCSDPELLQQVAVKQFTNFHDRAQGMAPVVCEEDAERLKWDIIWAKGKAWSVLRATSDSLFHSKPLSSYAEGKHQLVDNFISHCASAGRGEAVEIGQPLKKMSLEIIGPAAFGVDFVHSKQEKNLLAEMSMKVLQPAMIPTLALALSLAFPFTRKAVGWYISRFTTESSPIAEFLKGDGYLQGAAKALLRNCGTAETGKQTEHIMPSEQAKKKGEKMTSARKIQLAAQDQGYSDYQDQIPKPNSFFHKLRQATHAEKGEEPQPLTEMQIIASGMTFILAGFDSTSNAIAFTLFELAQLPEAQLKIREEMRAFQAAGGMNPEYKDIKHFPYTQACIYESLRMHPPINQHFIQQRVASRDTYLGKHFIPKDTIVVFNTHGLANDPELFEDPKEFRPERFLKQEAGGLTFKQPDSFLSFGIGPHKCIGYKFAIQECLLAMLAFNKRFDYSLDRAHHGDDPRVYYAPGLVFSSWNGVWLNIHEADTCQN